MGSGICQRTALTLVGAFNDFSFEELLWWWYNNIHKGTNKKSSIQNHFFFIFVYFLTDIQTVHSNSLSCSAYFRKSFLTGTLSYLFSQPWTLTPNFTVTLIMPPHYDYYKHPRILRPSDGPAPLAPSVWGSCVFYS